MSAPYSPGDLSMASEVASDIQLMKRELFLWVFSTSSCEFLMLPKKSGFCEITQAVFSLISFDIFRSAP